MIKLCKNHEIGVYNKEKKLQQELKKGGNTRFTDSFSLASIRLFRII